MKVKCWIAMLLALTCVFFAGCRKTAEKHEPEETAVGSDWRTWGLVSGSGTFEAKDGKEIPLLLCVYTKNAVLYYDDDTQTVFAELSYPEEIADAREAYASFSLLDRNEDGNSDVSLVFLRDGEAKTELIWYWDEAQAAFTLESGEAGTQ